MMKLPKGFEKTIIELEFQLEKETPTQELIAMLLSLYSVCSFFCHVKFIL